MKSIEELSKEMALDEFLKYVDDEQQCPDDYKLTPNTTCDDGDTPQKCSDCWNTALKGIEFKNNSLELFQKKALPTLIKLQKAEEKYKKLNEDRKKLKDKLKEEMNRYNINKWENDEFSITYIAATERSKLDSKEVKEKFPDVFNICSHLSPVAESIRFKVK
ncbi:hypothetical protein [Clostridium tyrobutyricum]|uniref:hypothetical protein n=1 Tax=Clostridium tyrobutyricum TaxID=1519 RepID=UPI001C390645|nr:hypothetical protein [Clostridium tyrobutyricum]MBV4429390.1 hypothetical protein [Clostridium tyrobutyricum]MBV4443017.1 hypothetical protein [Clostridium tyrobutyricum]